MPRHVLPLLALVALAACRPETAEPPAPETPEICAAQEFRHLVGQSLDRLDIRTLPQPYRIIGPDMAVTLDYRPERLNVTHDAKRIIESIACG